MTNTSNQDPTRSQSETRIKGFFHAIDLADKVQHEYQHGIESGAEFSWTGLRDLYKPKRGQWTVLTGIPSHGKSTFLDNVMVDLARHHGWKFLVCSPENQPIQRHVESLIEIYTGRKFEDRRVTRLSRAMTAQQMAEGFAFVDEHFGFIHPAYTEFNIDYLCQLIEEIQREWNFDGVVIDPYNELEHHRTSAMSETEYISSVISKFRTVVRLTHTHGWLVAHPTKLQMLNPKQGEDEAAKVKVYAMPSLYDVAGSAHWRNKADNGVVVYRDFLSEPQRTVVSVQKVRFRECGRLGEAQFYYDTLCNRFVEDPYDLLFNQVHRGDVK